MSEGRARSTGPMPKPSKTPLRVATLGEDPSTTAPTKPTKRRFTAAEKLRIVRAADACTERGEIEALLRREGIYSSLLSNWRTALRLHGEQGLTQPLGRKPSKDQRDEQIQQLLQQKERLEKELAVATALLALQKKVSDLLGLDLTKSDKS